jgi:hypothetical protein
MINTGENNTGNRNSGDRNSGYSNSGYSNSGHRNSGHWNSGDSNSGDWNACNYETGAFNTEQSDTIRVFNKPCSRDEWIEADKPNFLYFGLCVWVGEDDMTDEEKKADPQFHVRGGYLKTLGYKEAFQKSWDEADEEDRAKLFKLPNFDAEVFKEISGIDVTHKADCEGRVIEIDGVEYELKRKE